MSIDAHDMARTGPAPAPASPTRQAAVPTAVKRGLVLFLVASAQLMCVLDATIANVMLPELRGDLGLSTAGLQWVMNIYVVLFGGLMLLGGRLTDVFARRNVLAVGLVLFVIGSLLAAAADTGGVLLTGRALQGIGAAGLSPAALSILVTTYPEPDQRAKALGIWGTVMGIGASLGTLLGGAITEIDWRLAFLINVPIGAALLAAIFVWIPRSAPTGPRPPADIAGGLFGTLGLLSLVFGIVKAGTDGWDDSIALGTLAAAVVLLVVFVRVESTAKAPLLPLSLLRRRSVATGTTAQLIAAGLMLPSFFLLPQYMQMVLHYSPLEVGFAYIPTSLAMLGVSGAVPGLIAKYGPRVPYVTGTLMLAGVLVLMTNAPSDANYWSVLLPVTALLGVGLVLCLMTIPVVGTRDATEQDAGTTSAVLNASTEIGGALALAVTATVVGSHLAHLTGHGTPTVTALTESFHRGFLVLSVWVALNLAIGLFAFDGRPAKDTATAPRS